MLSIIMINLKEDSAIVINIKGPLQYPNKVRVISVWLNNRGETCAIIKKTLMEVSPIYPTYYHHPYS